MFTFFEFSRNDLVIGATAGLDTGRGAKTIHGKCAGGKEKQKHQEKKGFHRDD
jgi:hypothetical protein